MTDPRRTAIVAAAVSQIGPGDIPRYWASCGISPAPKPNEKGGAWCGSFTLWCLKQAGLAQGVKWIIGSGYVIPQGLNTTRTPEPGDVMYDDQPFQHYGIVESLVDGVLTTIEGNTPTVQRRVRPLPKDFTFYSINKFLGAPAPKSDPPPAPTPAPAPKPKPAPSPELGLLRGIDVSYYQAPAAISWLRLAETHQFVIVRATYGTEHDKLCAEHIKRAQDVGLTVGLYHFYRPGQSVEAQLAAFNDVANQVGMCENWLVPSLDIEQNPKYDGAITPERYAPAEQIADSWINTWGGALLYTNPAMWKQLDNPAWIQKCSLWISHYQTKLPTTPLNMPWTIWQHLVAPLPGVYGHDIDQNQAKSLPLISAPLVPPFIPLELDLDEQRRIRDEFIRDKGD